MMNPPDRPFVDGVCCASDLGATLSLVNPATELPWAEVKQASLSLTDRAVVSAQKTFEQSWRDLAPGKRAQILFAIAREIRARLEDLAQLECQNIGKPIADARDEIGLGATVFEYYAGAIDKFCGETIPVARGGFDFTLHEPLGVVAAITPWNFPFPIACWKVAPALAAGNCVVLKPANLSPLTALALGEIAAEAGLPAGALQVIPGSGATLGAVLTSHPLIRKISFTGSTEVGRGIMREASNDLKRVSLELGGKSPNIVFADANLQRAADESPMSVFANTGQDCCARSRVFVEKSVFDEFVERFLAATKALRVGAPEEESTQLGPLVSSSQRETVASFVDDARKTGQEILVGGPGQQDKGYYWNPTVILNSDYSDRCWEEEIFGPVVCITSFDDETAMLAEANRTPYGLSGSIWTQDISRALRVSRRIDAGVLSVNSHSSVHVQAPFGGFKQSGLGRDLGMHALKGYTELKNVYIAE
jgi:acyl-CoA reductase-like NAD-dependent aldehyde dehydrogenase